MSDREPVRTATDECRVLAEVSDMIAVVLEDVGGVDIEIGMNTQFLGDLDMESIDLVALSVQLRDYYGEDVNFAEFIAGFDVDEIIELSVGHLVGHITRSLAEAGES
ncbi:MAG: acyl carrier protein [Pseudonocardiaceae bacterium]